MAMAQPSVNDPGAAGSRFFKALLEEDGLELGRLIGSDFVLVSFDGQLVDGATLVEGIREGALVIDDADVTGNYVRVYQETGVVTGYWKVKGSVQGMAFNNQLAYTLVCAKQGGAWKVVSAHLTPVL